MKYFKLSLFTGFAFLQLLAVPADAKILKYTAAISPALEIEVNTQIKHELEGSYFYLGLANSFQEEGLLGFAHWFTVQFFEKTTPGEFIVCMKFLEPLRPMIWKSQWPSL